MGALMLFHVVFSRECFSAGWTVDIFLAGVFLAMACSVAGGGEGIDATEGGGMRAGIFLFWASMGGGCGRGGCWGVLGRWNGVGRCGSGSCGR